MDGPYNQHLVRDVGSLNLALVVLVFAALVVGTRTMARTAMIVWLVNAVPHFVYHLRHLTMNMAGRRQGRDRRDARVRGRGARRGAGVDPRQAEVPPVAPIDVRLAA